MERSGAATAGDEENIGSLQPREESAADTKGIIVATTNDDSKDPSSQGSSSRRNKLLIIFAAVIITVIIAFVLILVKPWNKDGENDFISMPTESPSPRPTTSPAPTSSSQPTTTIQNIADILGVGNLESLSTVSPEFQALEWMAYEDPLSHDLLVSASGEFNRTILSERFAIVVFYYATNGTSWRNQYNFLSATSVCRWNIFDLRGISCNDQGTVVGIDFYQNGLSGTIPLQLGELLSLESLSLWRDNLRGTIPDALGSLTQMTFLSCWNNELTGSIPDALAALTQLSRLGLGDNKLMGTIPEALSEVTHLRVLDVSKNQLTGTVPLEFQSLTALEFLNLYDNLLTGNLDPIFCPRPTTLEHLRADCAEPNPEIACSCCTGCA